MFDLIAIKNFQSHKKTEIAFEKGVNVIVGSSDQGKSAILRAILWAVNNRPLGTDDIVSHWARDKKNKIADTMAVEIKTENGIVTRKRTADTNEYILWEPSKVKGDQLFEAVNKEVPEDIQKFFRLSDVNVQSQHDAPFLLSASASDVAKYFNKIVRLDVIDTVLGNAESARRDTNKKIKETENEKKNLEKQLEDYDWIENAQVFVEKLLSVIERINAYDREWQVIDCEVQDYLNQKEFLKNYPDIKSANAIIEKIENIKIDYDEVNELEKNIEKYKEVNRDRKIYEMIKAGKEIIIQIESIEAEIKNDLHEQNIILKEVSDYEQDKELSDMGFNKEQALNLIKEIDAIRPDYETLKLLNSQILEYESARKIREQATIERADLIKQLPDECPLCGKPMGDCKDE